MQDNTVQIKNLKGRVGSYAISTVDFDSCINKPIVQPAHRTRKQRVSKEVMHKIFLDCAAVITYPFWVDKFNKASTGKFPFKFSYSDGCLVYKKGAKSHVLEVSNNPREAAYACMDFFRAHGGLFSPQDEKNSMEQQQQRALNDQPLQQITWATSNNKIQECLISNYVTHMKDVMKLTPNEVSRLEQTIRLGVINKYFGKTNIIIEHNKIYSINGLLWDNQSRNFFIDPNLKPTVTRNYSRNKEPQCSITDPNKKDMIPQFTLKWNKYTDSLNKKIIRHAKRQVLIDNNISHSSIAVSDTLSTVTSTDITTTDDDYDEDDE